MCPFIAFCDVMTIISHAVETFSIAVLEAMSLGYTNSYVRYRGSIEQINPGNNCHLCQVCDIGVLVAGLTDLTDTTKRSLLGERSRETVVRPFPLQGMIDRFDVVLMQLRKESI